MNELKEKRRCKRIKTNLSLNVSDLFRQDNVKISNIDSPIEVVDISKSGIGFVSTSTLPIGYYFNAALQLGSDSDILYCVVKIVRQQPIEESNQFTYGCEFVGMSSVLDYIFEEYEAEVSSETQE